MGLVLEKLGFDDTDNPLAPKAIVGAVEEALGAVQSGLKAKLAIIAAVGEHAGPELVAFYREVNELLRAKDVLPQLKYGSLPPRGPAARSAGGDATGGAIGGAAAVSPAAGPAAGVAMTGHAGGPGAAPGAMPAAGSGGASAGAAHPFVQLQQLMFGAGSTGRCRGHRRGRCGRRRGHAGRGVPDPAGRLRFRRRRGRTDARRRVPDPRRWLRARRGVVPRDGRAREHRRADAGELRRAGDARRADALPAQ
jgi:hypothetical protein